MMDFNNEQIQAIANWTLSGLTMYYRDTELPSEVIDLYQVGQIFRSQTFVDVSEIAGKLTKSCRFIFASTKAAKLYQINPDVEKWRHCAINANSCFKVLDIYKKGAQTQVFLLHIPAQGIDFFRSAILHLNGQNLEEQFIEKARNSFDQKMQGPVIAALEDADWVERTDFPIGLDVNNQFFPLYPTEPIFSAAQPLYQAIFKLTKDTELNTF